MLDTVSQVVITTFGVGAVYLTQDRRESWRKYAPVLGLLAAPAWFYTTITHEQWGLTALNFLYGYSWARGFYLQWIR